MSDTVRQPLWQSCRECGKTGDHEHNGPNRPMLLGDLIEGGVEHGPEALAEAQTLMARLPSCDILDLIIDEVLERRAQRARAVQVCPRCLHALADMTPGNESCSYFENDGCCCACWNVLRGEGPVDVRMLDFTVPGVDCGD